MSKTKVAIAAVLLLILSTLALIDTYYSEGNNESIFTCGELQYEITGTDTATLIGPVDSEKPFELELKSEVLNEDDKKTYTVTAIADNSFRCDDKITGDLIIPDTVTSVGISSFYLCRGLGETLSIPGSVKTIGKEAFSYCYGIKTVSIGEGVESIGFKAFNECNDINSLFIPNSVKYIGNFAFRLCDNVDLISIGNGGGISEDTFDGWKFFEKDRSTAIDDVSDLSGKIFMGRVTNMVHCSSVVTFDTDSVFEVKAIVAFDGSSIYPPEIPESAGKVTWQIDGKDVSWPFTVTEDVTMKAVFEEKCKITFLDSDGTQILNPEFYSVGEKMTFPASAKDGYQFVGWRDASGVLWKFNSEFEVKENTTFVAEWSEIQKQGLLSGDSIPIVAAIAVVAAIIGAAGTFFFVRKK